MIKGCQLCHDELTHQTVDVVVGASRLYNEDGRDSCRRRPFSKIRRDSIFETKHCDLLLEGGLDQFGNEIDLESLFVVETSSGAFIGCMSLAGCNGDHPGLGD